MTKKIKEISTGDYYTKAHKAKIGAAAKMMFADPAKPETQKAMRDFKNREAGMKRVGDRNRKAMAAKQDQERQASLAADKENLPALMAQFQKLRGQYDPNFEYSDDHSFWTQQKAIQGQLSTLQNRINAAGGSIKEGDMKEWKKTTKAPIRPRNFVAKNATTGGAGAHKDKKKDAKQGKAKHKKKPELAESATYERRLNVMLEMKILKDQFRDLKK